MVNSRKVMTAIFRSGCPMIVIGILLVGRGVILGLRVSVPRQVRAIAVPPTSSRVAGAFSDGFVRIWDSTNSKTLREFSLPSSDFLTFRFDPTGKYLAASSPVNLLSGKSKEGTSSQLTLASVEKGIVGKQEFDALPSVLFAPDGSRMAAYENSRFMVWNLTNNEIITLKNESRNVNFCIFTPDSKSLICGSDDGDITIYSLDKNKPTATWKGHVGSIQGFAISPDGAILASCGLDCMVHIWNMQDHQKIATLSDHKEMVSEVIFSSDGKKLASAGMNGAVILWDAANWKKVHQWPRLHGIREWRFVQDNKVLVLLDQGMQIHFWEANSEGREIAFVATSMAELPDRLSFSADGSRLAYADGPMFVLDSAQGRVLRKQGSAASNNQPDAYFDARFAGKQLIACNALGIEVLDAETFKNIDTYHRHDGELKIIVALIVLGVAALTLGIVQIRRQAKRPRIVRPSELSEGGITILEV